jgi:hypothetical protein
MPDAGASPDQAASHQRAQPPPEAEESPPIALWATEIELAKEAEIETKSQIAILTKLAYGAIDQAQKESLGPVLEQLEAKMDQQRQEREAKETTQRDKEAQRVAFEQSWGRDVAQLVQATPRTLTTLKTKWTSNHEREKAQLEAQLAQLEVPEEAAPQLEAAPPEAAAAAPPEEGAGGGGS